MYICASSKLALTEGQSKVSLPASYSVDVDVVFVLPAVANSTLTFVLTGCHK